jgi:hypothetical protein
VIYFAKSMADEAIKIGWTRNLEARLRQLKPGHHAEIQVVRTIQDAERWAEGWLHARFSSLRRFGEWFTFHRDMLTVELPNSKPTSAQRKIITDKGRLIQVRVPHEMLIHLEAQGRADHRDLPRMIVVAIQSWLSDETPPQFRNVKRIRAALPDATRREPEKADAQEA